MPDNPKSNDLTGRQIASIAGGSIIAAALIVVLVWYAYSVFFPSNPADPLTKAGGLSQEQKINQK
jgi:hypothetical protein